MGQTPASRDKTKTRRLIKIVSQLSFLLTSLSYVFGLGLVTLVGLVLFNLSTALSVLNYRKRDIVRLTIPSGGLRGILSSIKTVFVHSFDLILAPMFTMFIIINLMPTFGYELSVLTTGSVMFAVMTVIQISPLRVRKDHFTRVAHTHISTDLNNITVSRCMRSGVDRRTNEYRKYLRLQITAEESIRINSQFLTLSSGMKVMLMSIARFITPIAGTIGTMVPMLLEMLV